MSKHSTCFPLWCAHHPLFVPHCHTTRFTQLCRVSAFVQIFAALSAQSLSPGVASRITCWAASRLLPFLTTVSVASQKWKHTGDCVSFEKAGNTEICLVCLCLQRMCLVKTVESAPSVWRICYRGRPSPGWLASASTIRGNEALRLYLHKQKAEKQNANKCRWD